MRGQLCALMMILALTLAACGGEKESGAEEKMLETRSKYLEMTACTGHMDMTADYGRRVYEFGVDFSWEKEGETLLTLTAPENVAGATAHISKGETALEFGGAMLETGPLNAAGLSPIDALPALLGYAREGFLAECVLEEWDGTALLHVTCREAEALPGEGTEAQLWFVPETHALYRAEISDDGAAVIQCNFPSFSMTAQTAAPSQTSE